ncbi:DUF349 domain-containing protein [Actinocatenispora sera]|uniref:DUF349 domain-containing protein n=1 Tax=Actinocatenispora sera TaxID=390989 RepID=UPI00341056CB
MSGDGRDWTTFGRVDANGTVYVKTAAGERPVGSWQAGTPEEGLALFARRFADLVTEVELLANRLSSGKADAAHSVATIRRLRNELSTAHVVGDLDMLAGRLDELSVIAQKKSEEAKVAREAAKAAAVERKQQLVAEAEQLATESTQWKVAGDRLKEIVEEWKTIHGVDRKTDGELWKRYAAARDAFARRRGTHFASLDAGRKEVQTVKEKLVAEAESLSSSDDWGPTASRLKQLMADWKAAGRASKEAEQRLWERFRGAQDAFFSRRSEVFNARDAEQQEHLTAKRALLAEAEALDVDADPKAAQQKLRDIQSRWHEIGRVPRDAVSGLERRLRTVDEKVRAAMDTAWRRTPIEQNPLLVQMREQVAEAEERLERAKAAGDARRIKQAEESLEGKRRFLELAEHTG